MEKTVIIPGRLHNPEQGNVVTGANEILDDTKGKKQNVINSEVDAELVRIDNSKQDNLTFDSTPTENSTNPVMSGGVYAAELTLSQAIEAILLLIPSAASALNKLVDTEMMNSSIATATASFKGTYNLVTDLSLGVDATHEQIAAKLLEVITTADNNDYAFVQVPTNAGTPTEIRVTERYKFNGTAWAYEYDLNNSGFTAAQWAAINSGITALLVSKLSELPTATELATALAGKQAVLTFDNAPTQDSDNPVKSGGIYTAIKNETDARELSEQGLQQGISTNAGDISGIKDVLPSGATAANKLVDNNSMVSYVTTLIGGISATFNVTSVDGHITLHITQVDGEITSVTLTTSDIASAAALNLKASQADLEALASIVNTKASQTDLTTLAGRVSVNETDISNLQAAYAGLTQSDIIVGALPASGVVNRIYRVPGTTSYSDYMWNGSAFVLMATYNNAIDDTPTVDSNNLVKSGGVAKSIAEMTDMFIPCISSADVMNKVFITDGGQVISLDNATYNTIFFTLQDDGYYFIESPINYHPMLAKFSSKPSIGSFASQIILPAKWDAPTSKVVYLEKGYYALCFNCADISTVRYGVSFIKPSTGNALNENYLRGTYITDALAIVSGADKAYCTWKVELAAGTYYINTLGDVVNGHPNIVKYTDNTYGTAERRIFVDGNNGVVSLEAGYYAVCVLGYGNASRTCFVIPIDNSKECKIAEYASKQAVSDLCKYLKIITDRTRAVAGRYIADNGTITPVNINSYQCIKFMIFRSGYYHLDIPYGNYHPRLCKYTARWGSLESILIPYGYNPINESMYLEEGFYALSYNLDTNAEGNTSLPVFVGTKSEISSFQHLDMSDWDLVWGAQRVGDTIVINNGCLRILALSTQSTKFKMITKFSFSGAFADDNLHFAYGKYEVGEGADYFDINGSMLIHHRGTQTIEENIGFSLNTNEDYTLIYNFLTTNKGNLSLEIIGSYGEYYKYEYENAIAHGYIQFYSSSENCIIKDFSMSISPYDVKNAKIAVIGHSFVEGNSLLENRIYSFTSLLADAFGAEKVPNYGYGGDTTLKVYERLYYQLKMSQGIEYLMIDVGCNDGDDINKTAERLNEIAVCLPSYVTPIFHTITPRAEGLNASWRAVNDWIRSSGYLYVDAEQAFLDCPYNVATNANIRTNLLMSDNIHPTVEGHRAIFNRIMMDCPFLF